MFDRTILCSSPQQYYCLKNALRSWGGGWQGGQREFNLTLVYLLSLLYLLCYINQGLDLHIVCISVLYSIHVNLLRANNGQMSVFDNLVENE